MANKKYYFLDNMIWLKNELKTKSVSELSTELAMQMGVPAQNLHGSITFRIKRWFTKEEKAEVKRKRGLNKSKNVDTL